MSGLFRLVVIFCIVSFSWAEAEYVDLGRGFDSSTLNWITTQPFHFTKKVAEQKRDGSWYASNEFATGEHVGTHIDAPFHFYKEGWKVGDIPLSRLILPGVLMDMRSNVGNYSDFELHSQHISAWEENHGPLPDDSILLIRYGWGTNYKNRTKYFGLERNGTKMHFPGMSAEAADMIVKRGTVVGIGIDTPSVDTGRSTTQPAHNLLLGANIYVVENLDLERDNMPERDFTVSVMPMKIMEGTGAPCRVIAMLNGSPLTQVHVSLLMILLSMILIGII